ncbi:MAG: double zinc ribbon domain-containing protein [Alphaproteobacteria bacterium]
MVALHKSELFQAAVSLLYPATCTICGKNLSSGRYLCDACETRVLRIVPPFCEKCSEPFDGSITGAFACANCAHRTIHFDAAVSAYRGRGIVREIIHEFKYARQTHLRHLIALWLRAAMDDERLREVSFDLIVPVPLHPARQRERGFNQASLLAESLSVEISLPSRQVLERIRYTTTQTALDRSERMENLHNAFRLRKKADVRGLRVLLIDDVLTTGSTLSECARVLKRAGAISVHAATAARA